MQKLFLFLFTVFDEQRMRWLTSQNGRTGEFQEICKNKTLCMYVFEAIHIDEQTKFWSGKTWSGLNV